MPKNATVYVTQLLHRVEAGDAHAADQLFPVVYEQLRAIARNRMNAQPRDHTLQATALVNEAYVRLIDRQNLAWRERSHFFFAAARAMQDILVEHARGKARLKRGGPDAQRVPMNLAELAEEAGQEEILALTDGISQLEREQPQVAEVVRLRFYAGLTNAQTALALEISERQVRRIWSYGRAWLFRHIRNEGGAHGPSRTRL